MLTERLQVKSILICLVSELNASALTILLNLAIFVQGLMLLLFFSDSGEASCIKSAKSILFLFHQQFVWYGISFDIHRRL
jgi:hypothetical protein